MEDTKRESGIDGIRYATEDRRWKIVLNWLSSWLRLRKLLLPHPPRNLFIRHKALVFLYSHEASHSCAMLSKISVLPGPSGWFVKYVAFHRHDGTVSSLGNFTRYDRKPYELHLDSGEYVVRVDGARGCGWLACWLAFTTSAGRSFTFAKGTPRWARMLECWLRFSNRMIGALPLAWHILGMLAHAEH